MSPYFSTLFRFEPAVLVEYPSIGLCLEYVIYDQQSGRATRKRVRLRRHLARFRTAAERRREAFRLVDEINAKLREGWSPETSRYDTRLSDLRDLFLKGKEYEGCRDTTIVQYGSVLSLFLRWVDEAGRNSRRSGTFSHRDAICYADFCLEQRNRHRSYNNTIKVLRAFFQWAMEHGYANVNPFDGIKLLKKEKKIRILVDADTRRRIGEYYDEVCPQMGILVRLVYSSAVRPVEAWRMKVRDIKLDERCVFIPDENAKNHKERFATLTADLVERLQPVVEGAGSVDWFLFGQNDALMPDVRNKAKSYFQKSWDRMRRVLGLPKEMQLYSLRDTGLVDLLHAGVDPLTVRQHADHSSLAMQDIYTSHYDPELNRKIFESGVEF